MALIIQFLRGGLLQGGEDGCVLRTDMYLAAKKSSSNVSGRAARWKAVRLSQHTPDLT